MIAVAEPEPPKQNSNNDGCVACGCLIVLLIVPAMTMFFIVMPFIDYIYRWWF